MRKNEGFGLCVTVLAIGASLLGGCAAEVESSEVESGESTDDALTGRTTDQICDAVEARWGELWEREDTTGEKQAHVRDAVACANRRYWSTRFLPAAVHGKFQLHQRICESNPASHYAMFDDQRAFYCSFSLHLRMCNTQGLYALREIPDSQARRARERRIFSACLRLSGELAHFRSALRMDRHGDEEVARVVEALYDAYKVKPGVRVAPAVVNPERQSRALAERLARVSFYGLTVPLELLESGFSDAFLSLPSAERESQVEQILFYRSNLKSWDGEDLLDTSDLPICRGARECGLE